MRRRRPWTVRAYAWLLRRGVPSLTSEDVDEAAADVDRFRAEARRGSRFGVIGHWRRELHALATTIVDERRRARLADRGARRRLASRLSVHAEALGYDLRHALRGLAHDRLATLFIVASLTLGIGANAITLALMDRLLLRGPAQVRDPDRVVRLYRRITRPPAGEQTSPWLPFETYRHLRERLNDVASIGAYGVRDTIVGSGAGARMMRVGMTQGAFFPTLGVVPALGRYFTPDEDAAATGPLAMLSDRLWRSDFAADAAVVGRTLLIDGAPYAIVGVAPEGFSGPQFERVDAWTLGNSHTAASYNWNVIARLTPSATAGSVSADVSRVRAQADDDEPKWMGGATLFAAPIRFDDTGRESMQVRIGWWMTGVAAIILVVACSNVVNLLLVRLARRQRELGVRLALGSGRARLLRLIALEGVLLAVAGGVASVWMASALGPVVRQALFPEGADWTSAAIDYRLLSIVAAVVVITAGAIGIAPALGANQRRLTMTLGARTDRGAARSRLRAGLTMIQSALSVVLLIGAGLFIRSFMAVAAIDLGSEPERVIVAEARLDRPTVPANRAEFAAYLDAIARRERDVYRRVADAVTRLPGVERVSVTLGLPFDSGSFGTSLSVPGIGDVRSLPGGGPYISAVGPGYFETIGTRLLRGRGVMPSDREGTEPIAIVSETTAERLWPGQDAIGSCVRVGGATAPCARVVGVAADAHRFSLSEAPSLQVYVPFGQEHGFAGARLLVRPSEHSPVAWTALRRAIAETDTSIRFIDVRALADSLGPEMRPLRLGLATFGLSAVFAVATAALGLYGVMSYAVAWRRREIGIRLALGATPGQIRYLVVGNGVLLAGLGVALGLVFALAAGRWIQPQLFETSASDPVVLAGVSVLLLVVAMAAGLIPSRRAVRISPSESLRFE